MNPLTTIVAEPWEDFGLVDSGGGRKLTLTGDATIAQYTAASMVSELKRIAAPASVDSIPSSAMQEDHNSMGWSAGPPPGYLASIPEG